MFFFKSSAIANYEKTFFDLNIESISGDIINFSDFKNNVVLVVNTASYCGFTNQYEELQILWDKYKSKGLVVLAVPSNSFNQEKNKNNFHKILINKEGKIEDTFSSFTKPLSNKIINKIESIL